MSSENPLPSVLNATPDLARSSTTHWNRSGQSRCAEKHNVISTNLVTYEGECKNLGFILGLRVEGFNKKLPFHQFVEKVYHNNIVFTRSQQDDKGADQGCLQ